jgi:hypothetical protein
VCSFSQFKMNIFVSALSHFRLQSDGLTYGVQAPDFKPKTDNIALVFVSTSKLLHSSISPMFFAKQCVNEYHCFQKLGYYDYQEYVHDSVKLQLLLLQNSNTIEWSNSISFPLQKQDCEKICAKLRSTRYTRHSIRNISIPSLNRHVVNFIYRDVAVNKLESISICGDDTYYHAGFWRCGVDGEVLRFGMKQLHGGDDVILNEKLHDNGGAIDTNLYKVRRRFFGHFNVIHKDSLRIDDSGSDYDEEKFIPPEGSGAFMTAVGWGLPIALDEKAHSTLDKFDIRSLRWAHWFLPK